MTNRDRKTAQRRSEPRGDPEKQKSDCEVRETNTKQRAEEK